MPNSVRSRTAPFAPRRISGPVRRPIPAGPPVRGRTSAFERIARLPDYRLVDRLLRSRAWIWLIGIMLGGIVAMQVSLLKLNTGISRAITTQQTLEHNNQVLKMQITQLSSAEGIRSKAGDMHMVDPPAGDTRYLKSRGVEKDAPRAAKRYTAPSDEARRVMQYNGVLPVEGVAGAAALTQATPAPGTTTEQGTNAQVVATPTPVATPVVQEPLPTPVPTVTPVATATPVATVAAAPEG